MDIDKFNSKSEKALYAIYLLNKDGNKNITVEDLAVKLWSLKNSEFCMKGYPQYPNVDIQKYLTKLFENNFIQGGVSNYKITEKGILLIKNIISSNNLKKNIDLDHTLNRELVKEINRIINSKLYEYYISTKNPELTENDFFDFLGTSSRSYRDKSNSFFIQRVNLIKKDLIAYCLKDKNKDVKLKNIYELWVLLNNKFGGLLDV